MTVQRAVASPSLPAMGSRSWGLLSLGLVFLKLFTAALQAHGTLLPAVHAPAHPVGLIPCLKPSSLFLCQLTSPSLERLLNYLKLTAGIFFDASFVWVGLVNSSVGCQRSQRWLPSVRSRQFASPSPRALMELIEFSPHSLRWACISPVWTLPALLP